MGIVQAQDPNTMDRAISMARIQQQVLERAKSKWGKNLAYSKNTMTTSKSEAKPNQAVSPLWKERLARDYRRHYYRTELL